MNGRKEGQSHQDAACKAGQHRAHKPADRDFSPFDRSTTIGRNRGSCPQRTQNAAVVGNQCEDRPWLSCYASRLAIAERMTLDRSGGPGGVSRPPAQIGARESHTGEQFGSLAHRKVRGCTIAMDAVPQFRFADCPVRSLLQRNARRLRVDSGVQAVPARR